MLFGLFAFFGVIPFLIGANGAVADSKCICRAPGKTYSLGSCVCIVRPGGPMQLACCGKVLNNTSWTFTGKVCPVAMITPTVLRRMSTFSGDGFDNTPNAVASPESVSSTD